MSKKGKAKKSGRLRNRLLGGLLVLLFLTALGWKLYGLQDQLESARTERDRYQELVSDLERENAALSADIEEGVTREKMEEIARGELGMVLPDEYVFYNTGR